MKIWIKHHDIEIDISSILVIVIVINLSSSKF